MVRRKRMPRVGKPFKVYVDGKPTHEVYSPEEFEKVVKKIDRRKHTVRLV